MITPEVTGPRPTGFALAYLTALASVYLLGFIAPPVNYVRRAFLLARFVQRQLVMPTCHSGTAYVSAQRWRYHRDVRLNDVSASLFPSSGVCVCVCRSTHTVDPLGKKTEWLNGTPHDAGYTRR